MIIGQSITSLNKRFRAVLEQDGNFALYVGKTQLWSTNTSGMGFRVVMQDDGNLVLNSQSGEELWSTRTRLKGDYLMIQDDGNLQVLNTNGKAVWSSDTTQSKLSFQ